MVFVTGLYVLLSGARYDAGHGLVYWAFIVAAATAAPFALLCIALAAGLVVHFLSTRKEPRREGLLPVVLALLCTFVALLRALYGGLSHGGTVQLDGRTYHLAFDVPLDRDDRCIVFECAPPGIWCVSRQVVTRYLGASKLELKLGDVPHTVSLHAGSEVVASYSTQSRD